MKARDFRGLDCQAAFEGTSALIPEGNQARNENLLKNLCLLQHYASSRKRRQAKVTFDIDSIYFFPTSLAVASRGIN